MLAIQQRGVVGVVGDMNPEQSIPSPISPASPRSRFESLPSELRLQIYSLLLNGKPEYCLVERCEISRNYSNPTLYPAILAVNRFVSSEAYPVLYGQNAFLYTGTTTLTDQQHAYQRSFARLAGIPKAPTPPPLPEQSRQMIQHIAAAPLELSKGDWAGRLLELAPASRTLEFDFWMLCYRWPRVLEPLATISSLNASIPAIKSLVTASTQTFRIGVRDITAYQVDRYRYPRKKRIELPRVPLASINLKGIEDVREKRHKAHQALQFVIDIVGQRSPVPEESVPPEETLIAVEKRMLVHRDWAGFWSLDQLTVRADIRGWVPVDASGRIAEIGSECKSVTWRRSQTCHVKNQALYDYSYW